MQPSAMVTRSSLGRLRFFLVCPTESIVSPGCPSPSSYLIEKDDENRIRKGAHCSTANCFGQLIQDVQYSSISNVAKKCGAIRATKLSEKVVIVFFGWFNRRRTTVFAPTPYANRPTIFSHRSGRIRVAVQDQSHRCRRWWRQCRESHDIELCRNCRCGAVDGEHRCAGAVTKLGTIEAEPRQDHVTVNVCLTCRFGLLCL